MKKGKHFRRRKRKGKERRGNILEGETERKGAETFWKEKQKGKEWKHFGRRNGKERSGNILQRRRKERKIRKEEKACGGSRSDVAGFGELSFRFSMGPAFYGIVGGIGCGVLGNGWRLIV